MDQQQPQQERQTEAPFFFPARAGHNALIVDAEVMAPVFNGGIAQQEARMDQIRAAGL